MPSGHECRSPGRPEACSLLMTATYDCLTGIARDEYSSPTSSQPQTHRQTRDMCSQGSRAAPTSAKARCRISAARGAGRLSQPLSMADARPLRRPFCQGLRTGDDSLARPL